jgi:hypothetical protein
MASSQPFWHADAKPSSKPKCMVGTFFGDRFVKKEDGLRTLDGILPRIRGLKAFLYMAAENFELDEKYLRSKF